jgi:hypothetical protein
LFAPVPLLADEPRTDKPCSRCQRVLRLEAFNRESRARDGRRADCRNCQHATQRGIYERSRTTAQAG